MLLYFTFNLFNKMVKSFFLVSVICLISSCRYKNNDKLVIATVKQRLEKTWYLKEYNLNGVNSYVGPFTTLMIIYIDKNHIGIKNTDRLPYSTYLFTNKKTISYGDERKLLITKLTRDELWLEGTRIIPIYGWNRDDEIIAKYSTKP